jgi:tetratricopeptide (TPR) repeat protein
MLIPFVGSAHTAIDEQLSSVNRKIASDPDNHELYMRRAELHRLHGEWQLALGDLATAEKLGPPQLQDDLDFYRGQIWLEAGETEQARYALTRFLRRTPNHYQALVLRARSSAVLGDVRSASADYGAAIGVADDPSPGIYLEHARLLVEAGRLDESMQVIETAVKDKGPLVTLIQFAVDTEEQRDRYEPALGWIDRLPESLRMQPGWLLRSGDIHAAMGDKDAAKTDWQRALARLDSLPPARQSTPANSELRSKLQNRIEN